MEVKLSNIIAPSFFDVHHHLINYDYTHYWFAGGRASTKSSFISIEIILGIMKDKEANAVVLRKVSNTLKDSVFNQLIWAIDKLGVSKYWQINKSPLEMVYLPTGNRILFRGSDDPQKLKSTKFIKGYCKYIWYEEVSEFFGMEEIRNINQTLMRGGSRFTVFYSYNPPKNVNNWVNAESLIARPDKLIHKSTYLTVPREWLGEPFYIEAEHLKKVNELAYRNEYLGEATGTGGAVFENLTIREITDEEIKRFDRIYDGLDFGYAVDPSCYIQVNYDKTRKKLYIFNEVYGTGLSNEKLWERIIEKKIGRSTITADSAEPKSIDKLNSLGQVYVVGAKKGPDSVEYGIRWLQDLEEIIIDNVRCPNTAREFGLYEYERDKYGEFKSKYPDANNHSIDACLIGETQVVTDKGNIPIKELVGQTGKLLTYDYKGNIIEKEFYDCRKTRENADVFELELDNGNKIQATADHKILTSIGWKELRELNVGKNLQLINIVKGNTVQFAKIKNIKYIGKKDVYNLEVKDTHNFIANGIIVHNCRYSIEEETRANTFAIGYNKII